MVACAVDRRVVDRRRVHGFRYFLAAGAAPVSALLSLSDSLGVISSLILPIPFSRFLGPGFPRKFLPSSKVDSLGRR